MEINQTDVKILKTIISDARLSSRKIASKVRVSVGTVIAKIKKMEQ